jgi:VanZ family protein
VARKIKINKIVAWLPALLWMAFIFYLSSGPTTVIKGTSVERFIVLKSFHLIEYAILLILVIFATLSPHKSIAFAYLYSLSDELHQFFVPGRNGRFRDTLIDLLGIFIGLVVFQFFKKTFPKLWPKIPKSGI